MEQQHMFTNRMIRNLLVPVVLEQILNSIMGTADTMMVSNVGSAALSAGELAQKSLSERISNDPVIKEKLLSAEWITQEENLLLKVLPEYKEDILLFIAASGIKNITIC